MFFKNNLLKSLSWGYAFAFFLLILGFVFSTYIAARLTTQNKSISTADSTISHLSKLLSGLKVSQASWLKYNLTESYQSLHEYYDQSRGIDSLFSKIYHSSTISVQQKDRMDSLKNMVSALINKEKLKPALQYSKNATLFLDSLQRMSAHNAVLVDSITSVLNFIQLGTQQNIKEKRQALDTWSLILKIGGYIMLAIALFLAIHMFFIYNREIKAKKQARKEANEYHQQLEDRIKELTEKNKEVLRLRSMEKYTVLGRVASTLAHDIKNPLTSINIALSELKEASEKGERTLYLDIIKRNSDKIKEQLNHFLNVTAFIQLKTRPIAIHSLLEEILAEAKDRISLNNVTIEKKFSEEGLPKVSIEPKKMKTALLNIIFNAIDAMEKPEKVLRITTLKEEDKCIIIIADNGKGMDRETVSQVFEPYYTTKLKNGSGLGLAQTQNIILNHEGDIMVSSELEVGSRFIISLNFV